MKVKESVSHDKTAGRCRTGIAGLDDVLNGGFVRNRLYLLDGDPGTGKTTLSLQFLLEGVKSGERSLIITLSETEEEMRTAAASHGWSLDDIHISELAGSDRNLDGDSQLTMYHPAEVELGETMKKLKAIVDRVDPQRVVIDSLSELRLLSQDTLRYRRQILALKQFFLGRDCTVILLDDRTSRGSDGLLHSIAHGVLWLEQIASDYGAERRRVRVLKYRGTTYRAGYHEFVIATGGLQVFPRLVAAEHSDRFDDRRLSSGVTELDQLLGGGPDRGTSTLLVGPAGVGKSTIAIQYAVAASDRGDHAVIFAFDESAVTMRIRLDAMGIPFKEGREPGQVEVQQIDPAELGPGEFAQRVRKSVEQDGAKVVIIDSLNGYLNSMPTERFLTIQLHELLHYLGRMGVTTFMVTAQHGLFGSSMYSDVDTSYLADSVVVLRYFESGGSVKKAISVLKKRSGGHESTIRELWFNNNGIHLSEPLTQFHGVLSGIPKMVAASTSRDGVSSQSR